MCFKNVQERTFVTQLSNVGMLMRSVTGFRNAYHKPRHNIFWIQLLYIYFCYIHFEINDDPSNLMALITNRNTFCSKSHLFPCQRESPTKIQPIIRFQGLFVETNQIVGKWKKNFCNFLQASPLLDQ